MFNRKLKEKIAELQSKNLQLTYSRDEMKQARVARVKRKEGS